MTGLTVTHAGEKAIAELFFLNLNLPPAFEIRLCSDTIVKGDNYSDVQNEPLGNGYTAGALARSSVGFPTLETQGSEIVLRSKDITFTPSGGSIGPVNTVLLVTTDSSKRLIAYGDLKKSYTLSGSDDLTNSFEIRIASTGPTTSLVGRTAMMNAFFRNQEVPTDSFELGLFNSTPTGSTATLAAIGNEAPNYTRPTIERNGVGFVISTLHTSLTHMLQTKSVTITANSGDVGPYKTSAIGVKGGPLISWSVKNLPDPPYNETLDGATTPVESAVFHHNIFLN